MFSFIEVPFSRLPDRRLFLPSDMLLEFSRKSEDRSGSISLDGDSDIDELEDEPEECEIVDDMLVFLPEEIGYVRACMR